MMFRELRDDYEIQIPTFKYMNRAPIPQSIFAIVAKQGGERAFNRKRRHKARMRRKLRRGWA